MDDRIMGNIPKSGKEYLLYLREQQEVISNYILDCFRGASEGKISEQELFCMVGQRFRCELDADDPDDIILKGVVRNLLRQCEARGQIIQASSKDGSVYRIIDRKSEKAA